MSTFWPVTYILFGLQNAKWKPYLLTECEEEDFDEDSDISSVTFYSNVAEFAPIKLDKSPYTVKGWIKSGISPAMILQCAIRFDVSKAQWYINLW